LEGGSGNLKGMVGHERNSVPAALKGIWHFRMPMGLDSVIPFDYAMSNILLVHHNGSCNDGLLKKFH